MKFIDFCNYLQRLEGISSRNEMTVILSQLIKELERDELKAGIYLLQGQISPLFINIEFNFSTKLLVRSLINHKKSLEELNRELLEVGDVGLFLEKNINNEGQNISLNETFEYLKSIALVSGKNSQSMKMQLFKELLAKLSTLEAKFCGRIIIGKLRLGVSDKTILDALSWAVKGDKSLK